MTQIACAAAQGGPERLWTSVSGFGGILDGDVPDAPPGGGKRTGIGAGDSRLNLGSTQKLWEEAGDAVEVPCQQLEQQLQREAVLNVDGSGWFTNGLRRCILVFVAAKFVCYRVVESNNWEVLVSLLGAAFAGVLCSDRGGEYRKYRRKHPGLIQYCWSHLKRNIQAVLDFATTEEGKHYLPRYSRHLCSCVPVAGINFDEMSSTGPN